MFATLDRVVALSCHNEVGGDQFSALVHSWKKECCAFVAGSPKKIAPVVYLTYSPDLVIALPLDLHGKLLKISREAMHILVEWCDEVCLSPEEVGVPDAEKSCNHRDVVLERSLQEMLVHGVGTARNSWKLS